MPLDAALVRIHKQVYRDGRRILQALIVSDLRNDADVAAHCTKGFAQLFLGRADRRGDAAAAETAARAVHRRGDMRERRLLAALS